MRKLPLHLKSVATHNVAVSILAAKRCLLVPAQLSCFLGWWAVEPAFSRIVVARWPLIVSAGVTIPTVVAWPDRLHVAAGLSSSVALPVTVTPIPVAVSAMVSVPVALPVSLAIAVVVTLAVAARSVVKRWTATIARVKATAIPESTALTSSQARAAGCVRWWAIAKRTVATARPTKSAVKSAATATFEAATAVAAIPATRTTKSTAFTESARTKPAAGAAGTRASKPATSSRRRSSLCVSTPTEATTEAPGLPPLDCAAALDVDLDAAILDFEPIA